MARVFTVQRGSTRVVFGAGAAERLDREFDALGVKRVLVVCSAGRKADAAAIASRLGSRVVGTFAEAREHVPLEIATAGRAEASRTNADAVLAIGGGSAVGLAKAIAMEGRARATAVPTTYAGSEMTAIYGITEGEQKRTGRDERVRMALVVYDPTLVQGLPRAIEVASLWNALAHAAAALRGSTDRPTLAVAEEAARLVALGLAGGDREASLEGAYLAGVALDAAGTGLHHRICHVLGGMFRLPHASTHAVMLPHVVRSIGDPDGRLARALGAMDAARALDVLAIASGAPRSLASLGMPADGIAKAAASFGPDRERVEAILTRAFDPPAASAVPPIRAPKELRTQPGFGGTHESEALEGALPRAQNMPRPAPFGLYGELLSGTPFTLRSALNTRTWMYRIRASFAHEAYVPLPSSRFGAPFEDAFPNRTRWKPLPIPSSRVDFLDGLVTLGGSGSPEGAGYAVHLYAANADMADRCFADADGDLLIVPEKGTVECQTELGWLRASPGEILLLPRGLKFAIGIPDGQARGWMLEVWGSRLRLPERGLIGSNGLADPRHFRAPVAAYEDRAHPGYELVTKLAGALHVARADHTPFDVVAWHGNHVPYTYDLSLFNAMGTVTWDHPDPSILTVLTAPLDDHGRAIADFVIFPGRWDVAEHSFRPPFMHRNAASEINGVIRTPSPDSGYVEGCTFVTPLLTAHGVATKTYDAVLAKDVQEAPRRIPDASLWMMFESALPFRRTAWARETPLVDDSFLSLSDGMKVRFDPTRR